MSHDRNSETLDALKTEIKALKVNCEDTCRVIETAPPECPMVDEEQVEQKKNAYLKGLEIAVKHTNTVIPTDSNLLTTQFLIEIKQKTLQVEELSAYTAGLIRDTDAEISRLRNLISVAQEAQSKAQSKPKKNVVQPEHLSKAKDHFRMMKASVFSLIQSLFPHKHEEFIHVLGELMNNTDEYVNISTEYIEVLETLKEMNIVTINPHNEYEWKLNY